MEKYIYKFTIPAPKASDVVKRELHIMVDTVESTVELDAITTEYQMELVENSNVAMYLVDIDDAGNRSGHGEILGFVVTDVVAPEAPEAPIISDVIIVIDEPTVPTEPVEEPVIEEPVITDPVAEEPVVTEEPIVTDPVIEEPTVEEPVITDPVAEEPVVTEEPIVTEPVVEEPTATDETTDETTTS